MATVPDTEETRKKCICAGCPSFNQCMKENTEVLFCARGKTACELMKSGCICGACPLTAEYSLDKMYYCEIGVAE